MKTKNKVLVLVEIAVVLCSLFLVALPVIAAEQNQEMQKASASEVTTASEDDYVLGIYGNANEDDTIDMRDLTYVKLIFFGKKPETELADAKYDGKINPLDFIQIKLIIVRKEKELTIVDSADRIVTVKKPIERIVVLVSSNGEAIQILKATDRVVGIGKHGSLQLSRCFPKLSKLQLVGGTFGSPDYESILNLNPDVVMAYAWRGNYKKYTENLPDSIAVLAFDFFTDDIIREEFEKMGYILGKSGEAKEFIDFYEGCVDMVKEQTKGLSEDEKPRVYFGFGLYDFYLTFSDKDRCYPPLFDMAGGINIAADLEGLYPNVDPEWVIEQNLVIIIAGAGWGSKIQGGFHTDDPSGMKSVRDYITTLPELVHVNAVKNGKVYAIHFDAIAGAGTFIGGIYYAKLFHPELFEDLDPRAIHQEYLDFRGIDFNVYEHGVFVYPPLES
jgi:iron complex transport system substrate-binding protein